MRITTEIIDGGEKGRLQTSSKTSANTFSASGLGSWPGAAPPNMLANCAKKFEDAFGSLVLSRAPLEEYIASYSLRRTGSDNT